MNELELVKQINKLQRQVDSLIKPEVGRWVDFTPTVTQGVAVTVTVTRAKYITSQSGVIMTVNLTATSAGTAGSEIVIAGIPTGIQPNTSQFCIGSFIIVDQGTAFYVGAVRAIGANDWRLYAHGLTGGVGATPNFTLANTDIISFDVVYERA